MWSARVRPEPWAPPHRSPGSQDAEKEMTAARQRWDNSDWGSYSNQFERGGGELSIPLILGPSDAAYAWEHQYAIDEVEILEQQDEYERWSYYDNHPSNKLS